MIAPTAHSAAAALLQGSSAEAIGESIGRVIGWILGIVLLVWLFRMLSRRK